MNKKKKSLGGKGYFRALGQIHASTYMGVSSEQRKAWPDWAQRAYRIGFVDTRMAMNNPKGTCL
jgi:hypothetical protein